jgi:hypothetical protein
VREHMLKLQIEEGALKEFARKAARKGKDLLKG